MAHDDDGVGLRGEGLARLGQHLLRIPAGVLLDQFDLERLGGGAGAEFAGEGGGVAGIAAHLHVDRQAGIDGVVGHDRRRGEEQRRHRQAGEAFR